MNDLFHELKEQISAALKEYLEGGGETALLKAHTIGRTAVAKNLSVLEIADIYNQTLMDMLKNMPICPQVTQLIQRIFIFFMENLSIFDMLERGYLEASTMLHRLNETLDKNKRFLKNIFAAVPSGLLVIDRLTETVTSTNKSFCEKFCLTPEEISGKHLFEVLDLIGLSSEGKAAIQSYQTFTGLECPCHSPRAGRLVLSISLTGGRLEKEEEFFLLTEDVTERKKLEKEMARLERLNLVGEMAAGIGHEVRNPMTAVRGFLQLLKDKEEYNQDNEYFSLMIEELDRANSIITEFLSLAKNKAVDLKVQNLNNIIKAVSPLIEASGMQTDHYINIELGQIPNLLLNEKEIRQLVLNLVHNGLEAMEPGGYLTVRTFAVDNAIVLEVKDEGPGIPPEVMEKIGTPFFTTKENGTGLGLAVCYSIAARHHAEIKINTGPEGTVFSVLFKPR